MSYTVFLGLEVEKKTWWLVIQVLTEFQGESGVWQKRLIELENVGFNTEGFIPRWERCGLEE